MIQIKEEKLKELLLKAYESGWHGVLKLAESEAQNILDEFKAQPVVELSKSTTPITAPPITDAPSWTQPTVSFTYTVGDSTWGDLRGSGRTFSGSIGGAGNSPIPATVAEPPSTESNWDRNDDVWPTL